LNPAICPLCIHIKLLYANGWQLLSLNAPVVVARTCANTSELVVFSARRVRLVQFHAGVVEVNMQGPSPSSGLV